MASETEGGLALYYAEAPCFIDVSVSQVQSKSSHPSFSQAVDGVALPRRVQLRWSEPHCAKGRQSRRRGELVFARVSVSQSLSSWHEGAFGEFVRESNRRLNQVFRSVAHRLGTTIVTLWDWWACAMELHSMNQLVVSSSPIRLHAL